MSDNYSIIDADYSAVEPDDYVAFFGLSLSPIPSKERPYKVCSVNTDESVSIKTENGVCTFDESDWERWAGRRVVVHNVQESYMTQLPDEQAEPAYPEGIEQVVLYKYNGVTYESLIDANVARRYDKTNEQIRKIIDPRKNVDNCDIEAVIKCVIRNIHTLEGIIKGS